ncbi:MAG: class I SAM-dependent methyltransferase [Planctomycetales bacterium]|nr:class I SAM-dependent methyltransferase [Planctomycetales bacterium]
MLAKNKTFQRLVGGGFLEQMGVNMLSRMQLWQMGTHKDPALIKFFKKIRRERKSLVTAREMFMVYSMSKSQADRPGDFAEVGVYQGSTARIMCEIKGDKRLRLFDTFEGLPKDSDKDPGVHRERQYACSVESVSKYLEAFPNISYHKGLFPDSTHDVPDADYAFVHFDVDLYEGTKACLEYFYPKMIPGGIMMSHDYSLLEGVKTAFTEFLADKPETVIELPETQCMVIKL